jgi:hypothetical protein
MAPNTPNYKAPDIEAPTSSPNGTVREHRKSRDGHLSAPVSPGGTKKEHRRSVDAGGKRRSVDASGKRIHRRSVGGGEGKKKSKMTRQATKEDNSGMLNALALQFPNINGSFKALYTNFCQHNEAIGEGFKKTIKVTPLQYHCNTSATPLYPHYNGTTTALAHYCDTTATPL